tara:strand:- start:295 stop:633 length:339 start_codon:yes stop_codon:yes gene_type:complete
MPSLPFTFNEINSRLSDLSKRIDNRAEGAAPETGEIVGNAQSFLSDRINDIKKQFGTTEGLIDTGLAINPLTRTVDMGSKFFGGKGLAEGFKDGVIHETGTRREVRVPPLMF